MANIAIHTTLYLFIIKKIHNDKQKKSIKFDLENC